jgi:phosphoribosylpyrophosphate synthetase
MIVAITGIRDLAPESESWVWATMEDLVTDPKVKEIRFGGARGSDTIALNAAGNARTGDRPKLVVMVPGKVEHQPPYARDVVRTWADEVKELGLNLKLPSSYIIRNRRLVDGADVLVAFWDGEKGGTSYTIDYATQRGVPVDVIPVEREPQKRPGYPPTEEEMRIFLNRPPKAEAVQSKGLQLVLSENAVYVVRGIGTAERFWHFPIQAIGAKHPDLEPDVKIPLWALWPYSRKQELVKRFKHRKELPLPEEAKQELDDIGLAAGNLLDLLQSDPRLPREATLLVIPRRTPGAYPGLDNVLYELQHLSQGRYTEKIESLARTEYRKGEFRVGRQRLGVEEQAATMCYYGKNLPAVVLIDDVLTTGGSFMGAAQALRRDGVTGNIYGIALTAAGRFEQAIKAKERG